MYLLDTNTLIYAFRNAGGVRQRMASQPDDAMSLCVVTLLEFEFGFAKSSNPSVQRSLLADLTARLRVLSLDEAAASRAGQVKAALQRDGVPIGPYDLLMAGIALAHNLVVVTRNVGEFSRVIGLRVENWYE